MDEITWINHAGFLLQSGAVRLVCDPWLTGPAFDRGWHLLSPTKFTAEQLGQATHIWFSHEHPDHFSPADLKSIPAERRRNITVLFQRTADRRVAKFCEALGFKVVEMDHLQPVKIGEVSLTTGVADIDSWLHIRTTEATYLNVNDFIIERPKQWADLKATIGDKLDVLLLQFSYASWTGNRGNLSAMKQEAARKRGWMRDQITAFKPRFVVPFASFVYFAHVENFYLNEGANSVRSVFEEVNSPEGRCIVLYPGDTWRLGAHDSAGALERYASDWHARCPRYETAPVSMEELTALADRCAARTRKARAFWFVWLLGCIGKLKTLHVHFTDLGRTMAYRPGRGLTASKGKADISCTADAFLTCLRDDFGSGTLIVSGRFQEDRPGGRSRLSQAFLANRLQSRGMGAFDYLREKLTR